MNETSTVAKTLYDPLPENLREGVPSDDLERTDLVSLLPVPKGLSAPDTATVSARIQNRALLLDGDAKERKQRAKANKKSPGKLIIPRAQQKYSIYQPLATLWKDYAQKTVGNATGTNFGDRVVRMDLHGAIVEVVRSKDPGLVGVNGILVAETCNTIMVVTKADRVITIPKNVAVIRFKIAEKQVELVLPALAFRSSERSARKLKKRHSSVL